MRNTILLILAATLLLAGALSAQINSRIPTVIEEDEAAEAPQAPADEESANADAADEDDDTPAYADDLDEFVPTREIPPDEEVTFPVDF